MLQATADTVALFRKVPAAPPVRGSVISTIPRIRARAPVRHASCAHIHFTLDRYRWYRPVQATARRRPDRCRSLFSLYLSAGKRYRYSFVCLFVHGTGPRINVRHSKLQESFAGNSAGTLLNILHSGTNQQL